MLGNTNLGQGLTKLFLSLGYLFLPYFSSSLRNFALAFLGTIPSEKLAQGWVCVRYSMNNSIDYLLFKEDLPCPRKDFKLQLNRTVFQTHIHPNTYVLKHKHIVFSEHELNYVCLFL